MGCVSEDPKCLEEVEENSGVYAQPLSGIVKSRTKGKSLPFGVALDEVILNFVNFVGMIKEKGEYD